ncbi:hypothetical protein [Borreliella lanei]|uniref:Putative helicase n=1 Tax=Borreliella lanei TaxID=373540 RepID=A0A7W9ZBR9_9SPIR|nr:hypothetical protein [Borreliella lanei]MBB6208521.1 putative helicase [Borreliella lanei]
MQIFLANSIDETGLLDQKSFKVFFTAIGEENELTNKVKERQILVILGNPPYNSDSKNNNEYIYIEFS